MNTIDQVIERRIKEQLGELLVQNIARQARVEEMSGELSALQLRVAELERSVSGEMVLPPDEGETHHKANGRG